MERNDFKKFCTNEFKKWGFRKIKSCFYLAGKELLCGIDLQKSNYGSVYYVNFFYCIGYYNDLTMVPTYYDCDISNRILVMSQTQTYQGERFMTAQIEYEKYTEDELRSFFDKEFQTRVLPPVYQGKKYILDNLNKLYSLTLNKDEVMRKLKE